METASNPQNDVGVVPGVAGAGSLHHYVAHIETPGGSFKQMIKVKGAGGILTEDVSNHPEELEQHLQKDLHPRATSVKVEVFDPDNPEHAKLHRVDRVPASVAAYMGPTATGDSKQPRAKDPRQLTAKLPGG